jgi:hypothetical protein
MIISPDELRRETVALIKQIDVEIKDIEAFRKNESDRLGARMRGAEEVSLRLATLYQAKATTYNTLVLLQTSTTVPRSRRQ